MSTESPEVTSSESHISNGNSAKNTVNKQELKECCKKTISAHAEHNPMMLCQTCKHLIKCFSEESKFRNYITFCVSRGRSICIDDYENYQVVVFKNYEPFR